MAETKEQNLSNYKLPGNRGPRNRQTVEKAKDKKGTLRKLIHYFKAEKKRIILLMGCVIVTAVASVYAPRLQSQAIDSISESRYEDLNFYLLSVESKVSIEFIHRHSINAGGTFVSLDCFYCLVNISVL